MGTPASPQLEELMSHSAWLRNLARSLVRDPAAADDLVQETWLAALKNPPDPTRPARPWLAGVMRRLVAMRARGEARRARRQRTAARSEDLPSTAELVESVDTQRRIAQAVLQLAEPYRTTVLLRYYQQMSSADIARRQGIPAATVRWRLHRGLEQLREGLDQLWPDRRSWCLALLALDRAGAGAGAGAATSVAQGVAGLSVAGLSLFQWSGLALVALAALAVGWLGFVRPLADPPAGGGLPLQADSLAVAPGADDDLAQPGSGDERPDRRALGRGSPGPAAEPGTGVPSVAAVHVLLPDGSPARALRAVALAADGGLVDGRTDDEGRFELGAIARPATLFVKRPEAFLDRAPLPVQDAHAASDGRAEVVRLPGGRELSGRLLLEGRAPDPPIVLALTRDQPLFGEEDAPEPVRTRIRSARQAHSKTAIDGSFRFVGLAADWHGTLRLPAGYRFSKPGAAPDESAGDRTRAIPGPASALELRIEAERVLRGRIVDARGRPLAARVECLLQRAAGRDRQVQVEARANGRFQVTIGAGSTGALVRARAPGALGAAWVPIGEAGDVVLGELELRPGRLLRVGVRDASGRPVPGVQAAAVEAGGRVSWPATPEDGGVTIELPAQAAAELVVDAHGYRRRRVPVGAGDRLELELSASAVLTARVLDARGEPRPAAGLRLAGIAPERRDEVQLELGRAAHDASVAQGPGALAFVCDAGGRLSLDGLVGDEELELVALDPLGNVMASRRMQLEGTREHVLELRLPGDLPAFSGGVRDDLRQPIVGAAIQLTNADGASWRIRTDREGHFHVTHAESAAVRVEISKEGYETLVLAGLRIADQGPREFTLRAVSR